MTSLYGILSQISLNQVIWIIGARQCVFFVSLLAPFRVQAALLHSIERKSSIVEQTAMKIELIPALSDNYMYLLIDEDTKKQPLLILWSQ